MNTIPLLRLPDLPFCIGACPAPANPDPLPGSHPMELRLNLGLGRLEQAATGGLEALLRSAYGFGLEMGTPSDNTELGKPYVDDFVAFAEDFTNRKGRALEIGAGVGYLSRVLAGRGWKVDSIEPGKGYERHLERHGVKVINEFFPSPSARGPYDLIVFYTVLEHVLDTRTFLRKVADHLAPDGRIILSVPDCTLEIGAGDPSMLLHEHYQYFDAGSLARTLQDAGFAAEVRPSRFGRSLYACGIPDADAGVAQPGEAALAPYRAFAEKVNRVRARFGDLLHDAARDGSVGVYCPGRALALLPAGAQVRFFDDAPSLRGKYYPPFAARIGNREDLLRDPPRSLFIMSRTFGAKLHATLAPLLPGTRVFHPDEVLDAG